MSGGDVDCRIVLSIGDGQRINVSVEANTRAKDVVEHAIDSLGMTVDCAPLFRLYVSNSGKERLVWDRELVLPLICGTPFQSISSSQEWETHWRQFASSSRFVLRQPLHVLGSPESAAPISTHRAYLELVCGQALDEYMSGRIIVRSNEQVLDLACILCTLVWKDQVRKLATKGFIRTEIDRLLPPAHLKLLPAEAWEERITSHYLRAREKLGDLRALEAAQRVFIEYLRTNCRLGTFSCEAMMEMNGSSGGNISKSRSSSGGSSSDSSKRYLLLIDKETVELMDAKNWNCKWKIQTSSIVSYGRGGNESVYLVISSPVTDSMTPQQQQGGDLIIKEQNKEHVTHTTTVRIRTSKSNELVAYIASFMGNDRAMDQAEDLIGSLAIYDKQKGLSARLLPLLHLRSSPEPSSSSSSPSPSASSSLCFDMVPLPQDLLTNAISTARDALTYAKSDPSFASSEIFKALARRAALAARLQCPSLSSAAAAASSDRIPPSFQGSPTLVVMSEQVHGIGLMEYAESSRLLLKTHFGDNLSFVSELIRRIDGQPALELIYSVLGSTCLSCIIWQENPPSYSSGSSSPGPLSRQQQQQQKRGPTVVASAIPSHLQQPAASASPSRGRLATLFGSSGSSSPGPASRSAAASSSLYDSSSPASVNVMIVTFTTRTEEFDTFLPIASSFLNSLRFCEPVPSPSPSPSPSMLVPLASSASASSSSSSPISIVYKNTAKYELQCPLPGASTHFISLTDSEALRSHYFDRVLLASSSSSSSSSSMMTSAAPFIAAPRSLRAALAVSRSQQQMHSSASSALVARSEEPEIYDKIGSAKMTAADDDHASGLASSRPLQALKISSLFSTAVLSFDVHRKDASSLLSNKFSIVIFSGIPPGGMNAFVDQVRDLFFLSSSAASAGVAPPAPAVEVRIGRTEEASFVARVFPKGLKRRRTSVVSSSSSAAEIASYSTGFTFHLIVFQRGQCHHVFAQNVDDAVARSMRDFARLNFHLDVDMDLELDDSSLIMSGSNGNGAVDVHA